MTKKYLDKARRMYPGVTEENHKAMELIERLADAMELTDECKRHLKKEGQVITQSRGNYEITKENPCCKLYTSNHKLILTTMRMLEQICGMNAEPDELMKFLDENEE